MNGFVLPEWLHALVFYGRPYSTKGTVAEILRSRFRINVFSMSGSLKRYCDDSGIPPTELAYIRHCMQNGKLVSRDVAFKAFVKELERKQEPHSNVISFDGVPRDPLQIDWFAGVSQITVLNFEVSRELALQRRVGRIKEALELGQPVRPDDANEFVAKARQDEFDSLDNEMQRRLRALAEDRFYTIDASDEISREDRMRSVFQALVRSDILSPLDLIAA